MCPGCIGSALLLLSGASSAGGLAAALKLRSISRIRSVRERSGVGRLGANDSGYETAELLRQAQQLESVPEG